jgi:hypothetical protein
MLNEKQFRERAQRELREIGTQVLGLVTDRDLYRRLEDEVIQANPQLSSNNLAYLDLIRGSYTDATTMRLRRMLAPEANLSLRRIIVQLGEYPDLLHQKATQKEVAVDADQLDKLATHLKEHVEPHFAPHERTAAALGTAQRELDRVLDTLTEMLKKYYWLIADGYLDLAPKYDGDPTAVFRSAWLK